MKTRKRSAITRRIRWESLVTWANRECNAGREFLRGISGDIFEFDKTFDSWRFMMTGISSNKALFIEDVKKSRTEEVRQIRT